LLSTYYRNNDFNHWNEWDSRSYFTARKIKNDLFNNLVIEDNYSGWLCEIQEIQALGASKGNLSRYKTLDSFTLKECEPELELNNKETLFECLYRNLKHEEVGIRNPCEEFERRYTLVWKAWDGRLGLSNVGGSHHFCAARWLAKKLRTKIFLERSLRVLRINNEAVLDLTKMYHIFVFQGIRFWNQYKTSFERFGLPFLVLPIRKHLFTEINTEHFDLVFLDRNLEKANIVADVLDCSGILNYGKLLLSELEKSIIEYEAFIPRLHKYPC